jgi:hypothetical protein
MVIQRDGPVALAIVFRKAATETSSEADPEPREPPVAVKAVSGPS